MLDADSANGTVVADAIASAPDLASTGGPSQIESEPSYQLPFQSTGFRTTPDVSFDGAVGTGVTAYRSGSLRYGVAGTSLASPCWAGLIAIVNQGREAEGTTTLNSTANPTQTLEGLYSLPASDFHDITSRYNGFSAQPGYDYITGRGSPIASRLIPGLVAYDLQRPRPAVAPIRQDNTMTQDLLSSEAVPDLWKDNIWDWLLDCLDERCVIPIVGPDLLRVEIDGTTTLLDQYIARRLALTNGRSGDDLPAERALNHVVCKLLRVGKDRVGISADISQIMQEAAFEPSKPLQQLAEITDFNLFVTTTFDSLLENAINQVRFGNNHGASSIAYSPKRMIDLPSSKERLAQPTVYYLMGKLARSGYYVISDEDLLEYVCELQVEARRPERLFDELKKNHLLILGEDFSDWLARIFLRTAKGGRLSATRDFVEILADSKTRRDPSLVSFLFHFSTHTRVFRAGGAVEFVDEQWNRWRERHPQSSASMADTPRSEMPKDAIFISYLRADLSAVEELKAGLEAAGLPVWFDRQTLKPGDNFNPEIEQYITRRCSCFVAVLSRNTEGRLEGFFRREWNLALERDKGIHFQRRFIVPVVVDDTAEPSAVPPRFAQLNYTWLAGGKVTPAFVQELKEIVSGSRPNRL